MSDGPDSPWVLPSVYYRYLKLPVPSVGDWVLVFSMDPFNVNRTYLPYPGADNNASDTTSDANPTLMEIGENPTEHGVLGDKLKDKLDALCQADMTQTHTSAFGPTGPPVNIADYVQIKALLSEILSTLLKLK